MLGASAGLVAAHSALHASSLSHKPSVEPAVGIISWVGAARGATPWRGC